ncbi:Ig family protein [Catenulispora acidiphila DSM 44928]|uniref:Ig family protein n=1 Tax=Catenulispora acidiphila (strain DSM 44928 / JCM 14897 / NBRC 102108 / NRRL B-24433 / ID139908) TaxID=479433 RepID=C7QGG7_CATAD|nr:S53 family peptidase [Catenulispora acidiphila]ACU73012.1 Ig family protein [Catenulispora acidiphila DSM 44928]
MRISSRLRAFAGLATAVAMGGALAIGTASGATASAVPSSSAVTSATAALIAAEAAGSAHASQPALTAANSGATNACPSVIVVGHQSCFALKRNAVQPSAVSPNSIPSGVGYGPSQLQSAYNLTSAAASNGAGRTIALVDAYDYPTAAADLAAYRSAAGLPAGNFTKINQNGQTSPLPSAPPSGDDWTVEAALDMDMASAICPLCNIVLVEAQDDSSDGLYIAQAAAAARATYISNSWGGSESSTDPSSDNTYFKHATGTVTTVSAGDSDYGVSYPATSPNVVAVGGTALSTASNTRGWTESVWNTSTGSEGTGSGCSAYEAQPSWQTALNMPAGCSKRIDNDVAADADPATGVAVYDTYNGDGGWNEVGGTSASSPMVAAMYALAGNAGANPAQDIYQHTSNFYDVTTGKDASSCSPAYLCTAETGYDGPTGIGTPNGIAGLQTGGTSSETVSVSNPGNQTSTQGTAISTLQISATDSASKALTYSATGLPAGLSISSSGAITGTPTGTGSSSVTVTASSGTASGSTSFTWTVNPQGGTETVSVSNPGNQTSTQGTAISTLQISASDSAGKSLTYSATGLPAGLSISSSGAITGTPTGTGTSSVTVTASSGTASGSTTFSWTVNPTGGGGCTATQLLGNPGFETGSASPWTASAGVIDSSSSEPAHTGSWKAWLDGYGTTHTDTLSQKVSIPATCKTANFTFWLHIDTSETTTSTAYDKLSVQVLNASGSVLGTLATYTNLNHNTGYAQRSFNLASYIGQTITLKFTGSEDLSLQTSFVIDDTALNIN